MSNAVAIIDNKTVEEFLFSSGTKLSANQKQMFVQMAVRSGLDPFKREIYAIPYGNNFNIVTGYQTYIARANATGLLNGWKAEGGQDKATCTIYRKDWEQPFIWEVSRKEFDKGQGNWKTMPDFMLKKVCIAQAFRLAFPEQLGGLPYTQDEMEDLPVRSEVRSITPKDVTPPTKQIEAAPAIPAEITVVEDFGGPGIEDVRKSYTDAVKRIGTDRTMSLIKSVAGNGIKKATDIPINHYAEVIDTLNMAEAEAVAA